MKLKIERIYRKEGVSKNGSNYEKVDVYANGIRYTAFDFNGETKDWLEGGEIDAEVKKGEYNGKVQYTIQFPKRGDSYSQQGFDVQGEFKKVWEAIEILRGKKAQDFGHDQPDSGDDIDPLDELPF